MTEEMGKEWLNKIQELISQLEGLNWLRGLDQWFGFSKWFDALLLYSWNPWDTQIEVDYCVVQKAFPANESIHHLYEDP